MNAPHPLHHPTTVSQAQHSLHQPVHDSNDVNLIEYWDILSDSRWLIGAIVGIALAVGGAYSLVAKPVFEANLLIQVEDSAGSPKSFLGEAASLFDVKTPATAEIEIIRSRMVVGQAVDRTLLFVDAKPRYLPIFGEWLARRASGLSEPIGGWVRGKESIKVGAFDVPPRFEGLPFRLTVDGAGQYTIAHSDLEPTLTGTVGVPLVHSTEEGTLKLLVSAIEAKPGAEFTLTRHARLKVIEQLQDQLRLAEKGRQSGVIEVTLQGSDRTKLTQVLNDIGEQYVRQNVERRAAEAQKTLSFLDQQLPQLKRQLDQSEEAYNRYRNQRGTVSLEEEAKLVLSRSVELQGKLIEAQQKRRELVARFTSEHPALRTLDDQIAAWDREIVTLNARVKNMPALQQDALRLERDVKLSNELYQQLRNNALQLQLVREGKIGNARLIDIAAMPLEPVRPRKAFVLAVALCLGLVVGILAALARNSFFQGVRDPQEVEAQTGLNVYSTLPLSKAQEAIARQVSMKAPGLHILAHTDPQDVVVESLRSLRTALQFAMLESSNNRVVISGATPGVGKSFIAANFAAVLAAAGKRVLLVDADLRKGHLNQYFGVRRDNGLSELIAGSISMSSAVRPALLTNLDLIPTGILPPNPAELVMSGSFANLLELLSSQYDIVVIDTAPVLAAADTLSIAMHAGTLLLVARAGQTQLGELHESARRLAHAGKSATGVLFNAMDFTRRHFGSYGYRYGAYRYRQYNYEPTGNPAKG